MGKAHGICGIHAELLKDGGNAVLMSLHAVMCSAWNTGVIPTDWKRGLVVPLWNGMGDHQDCIKYRGVMLLSVPVKVFARIIIGVCAGLHTFQCFYGLDSGEDAREIKLCCVFWECQDL